MGIHLAAAGCAATPKADVPKPCPQEKFARPHVDVLEGAARKQVNIGGKQIIAELCHLDTAAPDMKHEWFNEAIHSLHIAPDGGLIVLDHEGNLRRYVEVPGEGCRLALDSAFGRNGLLNIPRRMPIEAISVVETGSILVSSDFETRRYKSGMLSRAKCSVHSVIGRGKVGFKMDGGRILVVDTQGQCEEKKWPIEGWGDTEKLAISFVHPWGDDVIVGASVEGTHYVAIHDRDGKQKVKVGKSWDDASAKEDERICWARDADACGDKLCVLDSNCRKLTVWDRQSGAFVGSVKMGDLVGLEYPWPVDLVVGKSAAYLAVSHEEKATSDDPLRRKEWHVGMIFRIKGLYQ
ncbi:MAG: hypothetical protein IPM54_21550 [Polyangiaceae bacterium]|nr:hypothetical protein [Polyangiaceae bacterium]